MSRHGTRAASRNFVVLIADSPETASLGPAPASRMGLTVSRKVGNAIVRNRVKRRVREWFRAFRHELAEPVDLVVIARRAARDLSGAEAGRCLTRLVAEARPSR